MSKTEPDANADKIVKSDAAWRSELTPEQYYVLRQHGTERPGTSPLNREKRNGMFQCAGCGADALRVRRQIRVRHGLAELRPTGRPKQP